MLTDEDIRQAADTLYQAECDARQIDPLTLKHPGMTLDDAYAVQRACVDRKIATGRRVIGYKIGLTSRAMQSAMHINEPDYGVLLDDMVFADGAQIDAARLCDPRIEVELAFVLKHRLVGTQLNVCDVLNATDYVVPALELIAARSFRVHPQTGYTRKIHDTIADNAASAGILMGGRPIRPDQMDLRWIGALCYRNGVLEETGLAAGVLNHPANGICWVAKRFAAHGIALEPGQIILSGSFTRPVTVVAGDTIHADFGPLGGISCRFL